MNLDRDKTYGTVWGHPSASFAQGGKLFNGAGEEVKPEKAVPASSDASPPQDSESFIQAILSGGPVLQSNVYKEVGLKGLDWTDVKSEAARLGVKIEDSKGKLTWSI